MSASCEAQGEAGIPCPERLKSAERIKKGCVANDHTAFLVTPQGLEPQLTESESVVLPITPWGNGLLERYRPYNLM